MKKFGISTILALVMLLTACGEDMEKISGADTSNPSTTATNSSSTTTSISDTSERSTSDLTESISDENETPEQEQLEKIPLTNEELSQIYLSPLTASFFKTYAKNGKSFDFTVSIDNIEMLNFIIGRLVQIIEIDEADDYEMIYNDEVMDGQEEYYYFSTETVEKLIQKNFLPSFEISSLDYKKSLYWNAEKDCFKVMDFPDSYNGGERECVIESGYTAGDYYYLSVVIPNNGYFNTPDLYRISFLPSEYFEFPRVQLKLKKYSRRIEDRYYDVLVLVGFEPVDDRPEWVDAAEILFNTVNWKFTADSSYSFTSMGIIDGSIGKRVFIASWSMLGGAHVIQSATCHTYGIRGENDVISCHSNLENYIITDYETHDMYDVTDGSVTIEDSFKGETYKSTYHKVSNDKTETYLLNDSEISKSQFDSAVVVDYFNGIVDFDSATIRTDDERLVYKYEHDLDNITLADLYEIARIITK